MRNVWVHCPCLLCLQVCVLHELHAFSSVLALLGSYGFMVFMVSLMMFVFHFGDDVVLTNAKGDSHRADGKEKYRRRERERTRKRDCQNGHRGNSPCVQSIMVFISMSLTAWTQCLGVGSQLRVQPSNIQIRQIRTNVDTSRFVRVILVNGPCESIPSWYHYIRSSPEGIQWVGNVWMREHSNNNEYYFQIWLVWGSSLVCACARTPCSLSNPVQYSHDLNHFQIAKQCATPSQDCSNSWPWG